MFSPHDCKEKRFHFRECCYQGLYIQCLQLRFGFSKHSDRFVISFDVDCSCLV